MGKIEINNESVNFRSPDQILNMGGPWIGELFVGNSKIIDNVIIDNLIYKENQHRLYFVRYHKISSWSQENYFSVDYFDVLTKSIHTYKMKFEMIFIKEITDTYDLIYYNAFHDKDEMKLKRMNLSHAPNSPDSSSFER
jgi:hypothetical protein